MTTLVRGARGLALVTAVLLLVLVPDLAAAKFAGTRAAPLAVSTATMVAPTDLAGTYRCTASGKQEGVVISVTGFTDRGPTATGYSYTLLVDGALEASTTSSGRSVTMTGSQRDDKSTTFWTIEVRATLGSWSSPAGSATVECKKKSTASGDL